MATETRICKQCKKPFVPGQKHKGFIHTCLYCGDKQDEPRVKAKVVAGQIVEITDAATARAFNRKQRRRGRNVLVSITRRKSDKTGHHGQNRKEK